ncbi:MAG: CRISPR-associated helicase Cas3' [Clostridia bacterium]|nr:CRISPR-associated helicase Cas3' [Clostridia bacterium]
MKYLAHIDPDSGREQTVKEHLIATATLAASFASEFGAEETAYRCGLLHDVGKYSDAFQRRIQNGSEKVDHSTAGAKEAFNVKDAYAAFCIAGHHGGLPDLGNQKADVAGSPTFHGRMKKEVEDYSGFKEDFESIPNATVPQKLCSSNLDAYFFTKMLYSCLVDADFLDTESFMQNGAVVRGGYEELSAYGKKLEKHIEPWWDAYNELNRTRCNILRTLMDAAGSEKGLFSLTVPTGGGKTVSSMAFALKHAEKNALRRVIYVIPYTSIIDQTADVFERIFGEGSVIAHHANAEFGNDTPSEIKSRAYLASENYDAPLILTTAVQFFESLYAAKPSRCRKLHNIANSVIIFDEAQMLPVPYLTSCVAAISQLVKLYGCSAVLCTATQPALGQIFEKYLPDMEIRELCPKILSENPIFKRVTYEREGKLDDAELARRLCNENRVLCIVNSRKQAQKLFSLTEGEGVFHLSTMMYPEHRRAVLKTIRDRLKAELPCRVISTSLVEAGVDVDFPTVYRAMAGLDSIIQAAGRCNREGKRAVEQSTVHIFETEQRAPETLQQNIGAARHTLRKHEKPDSEEAIHDYFSFLLYTLKSGEELDKKSIARSVEGGAWAFRSTAERFKLIDGCGYTIYIPLANGKRLTDELINSRPTKSLIRKLGQYAVGVYENHYKQLLNIGAIEPIAENAGILRDVSLYNESTGLAFGADEGKGIFI